MTIQRVNGVLASLKGVSGGEFALDDYGECVLETDDGGECVINAPSEGSAFTLSAVVGFVHDQDDGAVLAGLLQLNADNELTRGGTVSLDESGEVIVYRYIVEAEGLDGPGMMMLIANFFTVTDVLRKEIVKLRSSFDRRARRSRRRGPASARYLRA